MLRLSLLLACFLIAATPVRAANSGDAAGENYVTGQRHYTGDGVAQSYAKAAVHFRLAAEAGHPYAQYSLGLMFENGYGLRKDLALAAQWYQKAAASGHAGAAFRLGLLRETLDQGPRTGLRTLAETEALPPMPAEILIPGAPPEPVAPVAKSPPAQTRINPAPQAAIAKPAPLQKRAPPVAKEKPSPRVVARLEPPVSRPSPATPPPPVATMEKEIPFDPPPATESRPPAVVLAPPVTTAPAAAAAAAASAPPPRATRPTPPPRSPPNAVALKPALPGVTIVNPAAAREPEIARALREYQIAMEARDYGTAMRALEHARYAGEIPALGLDETRAAETLARLAILAQDDRNALVYLRQASALGSIEAQTLLDQFASGVDLRAMLESSISASSPSAAGARP